MSAPAAIFVRFQVPGWHAWDGAPHHRAYLGQSHRHLFHFEVQMDVLHGNREVEFHDLLDQSRAVLKQLAPAGQFGGQSCEMIATSLGRFLAKTYGRACQVTVSEDGECGAVVDTPAPGDS